MSQKSDPISLIVKINFLVLGLFLAGYAMYSLRASGPPAWIQAIFGGKRNGSEITLCETRIVGLLRPNLYRIRQEGRKWLKEAEEVVEIDFLSMEKWFGAHCKFSAVLVSPPPSASELKPVFIVQFVTQNVEPLLQSADGTYVWRGTAFQSPALDAAIKALESLPTRLSK